MKRQRKGRELPQKTSQREESDSRNNRKSRCVCVCGGGGGGGGGDKQPSGTLGLIFDGDLSLCPHQARVVPPWVEEHPDVFTDPDFSLTQLDSTAHLSGSTASAMDVSLNTHGV